MGQTRSVLAFRLLCENTVDERILEIIRSKQQIFDAFADKSSAAAAAAAEDIAVDDKGVGKIIEEEIERIKAENPGLAAQVEREMEEARAAGEDPEDEPGVNGFAGSVATASSRRRASNTTRATAASKPRPAAASKARHEASHGLVAGLAPGAGSGHVATPQQVVAPQRVTAPRPAPGRMSPRFCPNCGNEFSPGTKFCCYCGAKLPGASL